MSAPRGQAVRIGLFALSVRRLVTPGTLVFIGAVLGFAALRHWSLPSPTESLHSPTFAREGIWRLGLGLLLPAVLFQAISSLGQWRGDQASWRAPLPLSFRNHLAMAWAAATCVLLVLVTLIGGLAEIRAEGQARGNQAAGPHAHPAALLIAEPRTRLTLPYPLEVPRGASLRVHLNLTPGAGPSAIVDLRASWKGAPSRGNELRRHVFAKTHVDLPLPAQSSQTLVLEVERQVDGAGIILPANSLERTVPGSPWSRLSLGLHTVLAFLTWLAVGSAFATCMRPSIAWLGVVSLQLLPWLGLAPRWLPGGALPGALAHVRTGLSPAPPTLETILACLVLVVAGYAGTCLGFRSWRSSR